ncbi:MAG: DUF1648 domain-containing protein [Dysosmobacter sp.]
MFTANYGGIGTVSRLPERVPTHFDFSGTPDGWSSRPFAVFGLPCLLAALNVFLYACLNRDPKRANMSGALKPSASGACRFCQCCAMA